MCINNCCLLYKLTNYYAYDKILKKEREEILMKFRQVHLDFHTSEKIPDIGVNFDKKQFQEALITGHIESITLFSKCHHGYAYHPSKANEMHPHLKFDLLKAQIEAAHEIGVKTPVYLSAGLDQKAVRQHPEWMYDNMEHTYNNNFTTPMYHHLCFNTPYLDYLLAQIKEVLENYDADGLFLDITGIKMCCCNTCMKDMLSRGMNPADKKDVLTLAEEVYANYLKRVRETVDRVRPGLPVFHNGGHIRHSRRDLAYGNTHLELESLPTGGWGYDHFPFSASYVRNLGMEYLGMTGKFHTHWGEFGGFKHPNALVYETSLNAAFGAKNSIGDQLHPSGKPDMTTLEKIIYIADYIEPMRKMDCKPHSLEEIRKECFRNLDNGLFMILENTVSYLQNSDMKIDEMSLETYEYYKNRKTD